MTSIRSAVPTRVNSGYYRADIDGLRAVAVLLVVLCHAKFAFFAGGFVGVDVFFVISGYVVTGSLMRSFGEGTFSFTTFYARRAQRLMPALYLVLAFTFAFSVVFLIPDDAMEVAKNMAYVGLFASNLYLAKQTGYFDADAEHQPLLHTWSLSVEEQFYLVFPLVLVALRRVDAKARFCVVFVLMGASLAAAQWAGHSGKAGAYYFAQYRAFEFLIGVLLSLVHTAACARGAIANIAVAFGVLALGFSVCGLSGATLPGVWALVPCLAAALIIFGGMGTWGRVLLANRMTVWAGRRSYGLYL